jgi:hypothetical protein
MILTKATGGPDCPAGEAGMSVINAWILPSISIIRDCGMGVVSLFAIKIPAEINNKTENNMIVLLMFSP